MPEKRKGKLEMWKEITICIIIIIAVLVGNIITQKYTKQSVQTLTEDLSNLKTYIQDIEDGNNVNENVQEKADKIKEDWKNVHDNLAYYMEHNELEKVENDITSMQSYIKSKEYKQAINDLDKCVFILRHMEEKYAFSLENVF